MGNLPSVEEMRLYNLERRQREDYAQAMLYQFLEPSKEVPVCKHFGCGLQLTITEQLFGEKCIRHSIVTEKQDAGDFIND